MPIEAENNATKNGNRRNWALILGQWEITDRELEQLPFDSRSFRVVFYNDTIGGKAEVEKNLRRHLDAIAGR